jgi:hypothetical protein
LHIHFTADPGSIAAGRIDNFTVLEQDRHKVKPIQLRNIPIWGTVFEGQVSAGKAKLATAGAVRGAAAGRLRPGGWAQPRAVTGAALPMQGRCSSVSPIAARDAT